MIVSKNFVTMEWTALQNSECPLLKVFKQSLEAFCLGGNRKYS